MTDEYKGLSEDKVISLLNKFYSIFFGIYQNENFLNKNSLVVSSTTASPKNSKRS